MKWYTVHIHTYSHTQSSTKESMDIANMKKEDWFQVEQERSNCHSTQTQSSCPSSECMLTHCCYILSFDLRSLIQECFQRGCHPGYETYSCFRAAETTCSCFLSGSFCLSCWMTISEYSDACDCVRVRVCKCMCIHANDVTLQTHSNKSSIL